MFSRVLVVLTSLCVATMLSGCLKLLGGGWFYGEEFVGDGKVTFGFQAKCVFDSGDQEFPWAFYEGQFQYSDKDNGVQFHGNIDPFLIDFIDEAADCHDAAAALAEYFGTEGNGGFFSGKCWTQPGKVEGTFTVGITDWGTPGPSAGDNIDVTTTCTPDGEEYHNEGQLGGGNLIALGL